MERLSKAIEGAGRYAGIGISTRNMENIDVLVRTFSPKMYNLVNLRAHLVATVPYAAIAAAGFYATDYLKVSSKLNDMLSLAVATTALFFTAGKVKDMMLRQLVRKAERCLPKPSHGSQPPSDRIIETVPSLYVYNLRRTC